MALIEVAELSSGKPLGHILVDTGNASFIPKFICSSGDYLVFTDNQKRVVVHSLSTGQQLGRVFGVYATVTAPGKLLAVENAAGQVTIYDLPSMQKRDEIAFGGEVVYQRFTPDGKLLLVVTDDHLARLIDVGSTQP